MKRSIHLFVAIWIVLAVSPVHAQRFYAGVLGGMNIADFKLTFAEGGPLLYDVKNRTFFGAGVVLGLRLTDFLSLQTEPMYQTHGGIYLQPFNQELTLRLRVLELPLFIKAACGKKIRPFLMVGPILHVRLNSEAEATISGLDFKGDMDGVLKRMSWGLGLAGGIQVPLKRGWLFLEGRYSFGIGNFNKGGVTELTANGYSIPLEMDAIDVLKMINKQIMLGFALPLGKQ